jgi:hypothetical protein
VQRVRAKLPLGALDRHPCGQPEPIVTHEGVILVRRNRWHACKKPGDQAVQLASRCAAAYNNRGLAYNEKCDYERAIAVGPRKISR